MMCFHHARGYGWSNLPIGTVRGLFYMGKTLTFLDSAK